MPGHKRQYDVAPLVDFPNPFLIDITEVDGFDNLHHPQGILKDSMEWAAEVYGSDRTYYLVNGSSSGILSAISGTVTRGGTILMSRNCHKSAYNGAQLRDLDVVYLYPEVITEFGLQGGISPDDVASALENNPNIQSVIIVSPTYDGVVSDIKRIAEIVHRHNIPFIVDEAHGAHFSFAQDAPNFPTSALQLGADVVIQSMHKTLPSLTQTAVMHIKEGYVDSNEIGRYTHIYQSTSPSYVLLASIDQCIAYMADEGRVEMVRFGTRLTELRNELSSLRHLQLVSTALKGRFHIYDIDPSRIVISTRGTGISGAELDQKLRQNYQLEMEMYGPDYATAMVTLGDSVEGTERLVYALRGIDSTLSSDISTVSIPPVPHAPEHRMKMAEASEAAHVELSLAEAVDRVSAEFVYVYPPGIPIVTPGEVLTQDVISLIMQYKALKLPVQGMQDEQSERIFVVK